MTQERNISTLSWTPKRDSCKRSKKKVKREWILARENFKDLSLY